VTDDLRKRFAMRQAGGFIGAADGVTRGRWPKGRERPLWSMCAAEKWCARPRPDGQDRLSPLTKSSVATDGTHPRVMDRQNVTSVHRPRSSVIDAAKVQGHDGIESGAHRRQISVIGRSRQPKPLRGRHGANRRQFPRIRRTMRHDMRGAVLSAMSRRFASYV